MMIGLRHLNHVEALAEHGTFSGAAQALGISQPALSRSIRRLEHQLGVTLFDRGGAGGVEPTLFGRLLVARGATLLQESRELIREVQLLQGLHTGELTVCAGFFPAALSVHLAVGNLLADYPGIRCRVHVADWREGTAQVLARRADLAVAELSAAREHPQLEVVPLARHAFLFRARAGHPILRLENPAIEDLLAYPWVGTRAPARITTVLPSPPFAAGSIDHATGDFVPAVLVGDLESTERVLARGNAIGPGLAWRRDPPGLADALVPIPFTAPWMRLDYGIIRLRDRSLSPAAQAFVDELRKIEATLPPS